MNVPDGAPGSDDLGSKHHRYAGLHTSILSRIRIANPQPGSRLRAPFPKFWTEFIREPMPNQKSKYFFDNSTKAW
jgi:hypothetical protein